MTIDLKQPELQALIRLRMQTGLYGSVEEVLLEALRTAPLPAKAQQATVPSGRTGADLIAAMQACPYPDFDFEAARLPMPVRDVTL